LPRAAGFSQNEEDNEEDDLMQDEFDDLDGVVRPKRQQVDNAPVNHLDDDGKKTTFAYALSDN
jgi:hypothetical protein